MNKEQRGPSPWIPIVITLLTLVAGGGWGKYYLEKKNTIKEENQRLIAEYLSPIDILLTDNKSIYSELYDSYLEPGWGILESYVERVQSDGFDNHALMKSRILQLDKNNDEIVLLLKQYSGHIISEEFLIQSRDFRKHAIAWSNRLDAIAEVIKTDEQFPIAMPFPEGFPNSLSVEINARKKIIK